MEVCRADSNSRIRDTMARLRIGTCSWRFPSWAGLVYSAPKGINYLREYAEKYDTVEIDRWFWSLFEASEPRLPASSDVEQYRTSVGSNFRFTVKAPNSITLTHFYRKSKADPLVTNPHFLSPDLFARFMSLLEPFGRLLGPVILQFGYLNREHLSGQDEFLERLEQFVRQTPQGPQYALEIRNPRWLNRQHFEFLAEQSIIPVLLQGYWMPPIADVADEWHEWLPQDGAVVIRLHGPDREGVEEETGGKWDRLVRPRDEELAAIVGLLETLLSAGVSVYVNVNNHYEGSAPLTIGRIQALLAQR